MPPFVLSPQAPQVLGSGPLHGRKVESILCPSYPGAEDSLQEDRGEASEGPRRVHTPSPFSYPAGDTHTHTHTSLPELSLMANSL